MIVLYYLKKISIFTWSLQLEIKSRWNSIRVSTLVCYFTVLLSKLPSIFPLLIKCCFIYFWLIGAFPSFINSRFASSYILISLPEWSCFITSGDHPVFLWIAIASLLLSPLRLLTSNSLATWCCSEASPTIPQIFL